MRNMRLMLRLFALALVLWFVLLTAAAFAAFYISVLVSVCLMMVLLATSWLLARRIELEGRRGRSHTNP